MNRWAIEELEDIERDADDERDRAMVGIVAADLWKAGVRTVSSCTDEAFAYVNWLRARRNRPPLEPPA